MLLILLSGPPASGKTTLVKNIIKNGTIISPDNLIGYSKENPWTPQAAKFAWKKSDKDLLEALNKKHDVIIFDATFVSVKRRRKYIKLCKDYNYKIGIIYCYASNNSLFERNKNREQFRKVPNHIVNNMINSFSVPTKEEGFDLIVKYDSEENKFYGDFKQLKTLLNEMEQKENNKRD